MQVQELSLPSVLVIGASKAVDERGFFSETFNARDFEQSGIHDVFVQDNFASSPHAGTLRGLHFQRPPHAQAKLVRVFRGRIWDVVVDVRTGSPTYGHWQGVELSADNWSQIYIPVGFAHGYVTLEDNVEVFYKVSDFYAPECEGGVAWNDPDLNIAWPFGDLAAQLSEKDEKLPAFKDLNSPFQYNALAVARKTS